jgi:cobalamin biosynthesis Mg chelatase CobN
MRFTSIFVAGAFATMAAAQSKTVSMSPAQQSQMDCLDECEAGDVKCQSYCITVPSPDEKNIEETTKCVAACPKGKGSEADTQKYTACMNECIADNYWKSVDGTPRGTDVPDVKSKASEAAASASDAASSAAEKATATGTASESDATATGASATNSESGSESGSEETGTATGTAAEVSETGNAASSLVGGVSFLGLVAAIFAL